MVRRSQTNPIFHPYYINYGFNKVSFISRLIYDGKEVDDLVLIIGFHFYVIPYAFGVDIPHPP